MHSEDRSTNRFCSNTHLWNDALLSRLLFSHHGVGFSSSGLTVGEYTDVVALKGVKQHLLPDVQIHLPLGRERWVVLLHTHTHRDTHTERERHRHTHTHTHTHTHSEFRATGAQTAAVNSSAGSYRAVRPVRIIKAEVLGCFFGLFGVPDA